MIKSLENYRNKISQFHGNYFFRGHADKSYKLIPSIYREKKLIENEHNIFRDIVQMIPSEFEDSKSAFEHLAKMQHYSIPTRLLDITENPLVALYFACSSENESDGEVVVVSSKDKNYYYDSDLVSVLSNLAKVESKMSIADHVEFMMVDHKPHDDVVRAFNETFFAQKLIHEIRNDKSYFQSIIDPYHLNKVIIVKPKLNNLRIVRQSGLFLLFGFKSEKEHPTEVGEELIEYKDSERLIVSSGSKKNILNELDKIGINEQYLFPEIQYQAKFVKEKYLKNGGIFSEAE